MKKLQRRSFFEPRIFETLEPRLAMALLNLAPVAAADSFSSGEDQLLTGNVVAGPTGTDAPASAGMSLRVVEVDGNPVVPASSLVLASGATLAMSATGSFSYDPSTSATLSAIPAGGSGQDSFNYLVAPDFSNLFVFGDSLSDQGRLFAATGQQFPPDPPYFQGRISNGPVWIESLAAQLDLPLSLANNFSVAGAATDNTNYNESTLMTDLPGLADELQGFLGGLNGQPADPNALYVVWAGANDIFLQPTTPPAVVIGQAVTNLGTTVGTLQAVGAQHILVMNLPDLGLTPYARSNNLSSELTALSSAFNGALQGALAGPGLQATLIDIFSTFQDVVANPAAYELTNVTDAAFNGTTVIGNPADFLFWDSVHPTDAGHRLIANAVLEALSDTAQVNIQVTDNTSPPLLTVRNFPGSEANSLRVELSASDASPADQSGLFQYVVNWGDGSPVQTVTAESSGTALTHTFATSGPQRVSASVRDQDGDTSATLSEVVFRGTENSDQFTLITIGHNKVRVISGARTVAMLNTADFDRLVILALGGNDLINAVSVLKPVEVDGGAGRDQILGGRGDDILRGGLGDDFLNGFNGHDLMFGDSGHDILFGGAGNDTLDGGAGNDYLFGQAGDDWLIGGSGLDWLLDVQGRNRRQDD
jgi:thermolabile hemolysin